MVIRVEHAARGKTFDNAQLLNPEQNERRPDIIEELDSNACNAAFIDSFYAIANLCIPRSLRLWFSYSVCAAQEQLRQGRRRTSGQALRAITVFRLLARDSPSP